jgi:Flp pilus assembly protein TadG
MSDSKFRLWKRLATDDGGSQIAEAALVLPIVFTLLFAILSFARAYNIYTTITYAAQEGARVANGSTCALNCGNKASTATDVFNRVSAVLKASSVDPSQIQTYAGTSTLNPCPGTTVSCNSKNNVQACTNVEMNAPGGTVTGPTSCGAVVTFKYPFGFQIPFFSQSGQRIFLKADVQMPTEE